MDSKSTQRIVDSHIHWWDLENNYYPWLTDERPDDGGLSGVDSIAHTYLPEHYAADAAGYDIIGVVHIQCGWDPSNPVGETQWLQALADSGKAGGAPQGIVGFADLADPAVEPLLEAHAGYANVRGIRHMLNYLPDNPALCWADQDYSEHPTWLANFGLLKKYGLSFDLMCFSNHMQAMADLASKHPETQIFLEHTGMPHDHTADGRALWRQGLQALAANENVVAKISGLGNTIADWTEPLIEPYVLETIEIFGVERCCFASNFPTDKQFSSMDAIWSAFLSITDGFSATEKDRLFAENAIRYYQLDL